MPNQADINISMRGAQVHSTSGAAHEAAQSAAAQAEAALMAAKEKAAQTASQVCSDMLAEGFPLCCLCGTQDHAALDRGMPASISSFQGGQ